MKNIIKKNVEDKFSNLYVKDRPQSAKREINIFRSAKRDDRNACPRRAQICFF